MTPADQHALREALARAEAERDAGKRRLDAAMGQGQAWREAAREAEARALAAEAENTRLKDTVEAARAALKPFADHGRLYAAWIAEGRAPLPEAEHFERARSVLATIPPKENPDGGAP